MSKQRHKVSETLFLGAIVRQPLYALTLMITAIPFQYIYNIRTQISIRKVYQILASFFASVLINNYFCVQNKGKLVKT